MIIDAHVHSFPQGFLPEPMHEASARRWAYGVWPNRDPADIRDKIEPGFTDPDGELLIGDLDEAGVDAAAVMMLDHGIGYGKEPPVSVRSMMEHYSGLQQKYDGRLHVFANVDPRREDALELLRYGLEECRLRGLKVYPPNGFYVSSDECRPLLRLCSDLSLPVLVHTAMMTYPLQGYYANPLYLATVQHQFPDLKLIFGHSGYPIWAEEACLTVEGHENSYLEISQWSWLAQSDPGRLTKVLGRFRDVVGPHRILFASDHVPGARFSGDRSKLPVLLDFMKNLPATAPDHGVSFSEEELELIMGGNAARVYGFSPGVGTAP